MPSLHELFEADLRGQFEITECHHKSANILAHLHAETFPESPWSAAWFEAFLQKTTSVVRLIQDRGQPAGLLVAALVQDELEILSIGVLQDYRRYGLGKILLQSVLTGSVAKCHLEVEHGNVAALALYRSSGFQQVGQRLDYYGKGQDAVTMVWHNPQLFSLGD